MADRRSGPPLLLLPGLCFFSPLLMPPGGTKQSGLDLLPRLPVGVALRRCCCPIATPAPMGGRGIWGGALPTSRVFPFPCAHVLADKLVPWLPGCFAPLTSHPGTLLAPLLTSATVAICVCHEVRTPKRCVCVRGQLGRVLGCAAIDCLLTRGVSSGCGGPLPQTRCCSGPFVEVHRSRRLITAAATWWNGLAGLYHRRCRQVEQLINAAPAWWNGPPLLLSV